MSSSGSGKLLAVIGDEVRAAHLTSILATQTIFTDSSAYSVTVWMRLLYSFVLLSSLLPLTGHVHRVSPGRHRRGKRQTATQLLGCGQRQVLQFHGFHTPPSCSQLVWCTAFNWVPPLFPDTAVGDIEEAFKTFTSRTDIVVLLINQNVSELVRQREPVCFMNGISRASQWWASGVILFAVDT